MTVNMLPLNAVAYLGSRQHGGSLGLGTELVYACQAY